jgi:hypothetical protein
MNRMLRGFLIFFRHGWQIFVGGIAGRRFFLFIRRAYTSRFLRKFAGQ